MHGRRCDFGIRDQIPTTPFLLVSTGEARDHNFRLPLHWQAKSPAWPGAVLELWQAIGSKSADNLPQPQDCTEAGMRSQCCPRAGKNNHLIVGPTPGLHNSQLETSRLSAPALGQCDIVHLQRTAVMPLGGCTDCALPTLPSHRDLTLHAFDS